MASDHGMRSSPIGQRPAWRLGCFALNDVRYQLFFVRVLFCTVLCYEQMFNMLDMTVITLVDNHACGFTVTMVIITSLQLQDHDRTAL
jgi:hypothetical protein